MNKWTILGVMASLWHDLTGTARIKAAARRPAPGHTPPEVSLQHRPDRGQDFITAAKDVAHAPLLPGGVRTHPRAVNRTPTDPAAMTAVLTAEARHTGRYPSGRPLQNPIKNIFKSPE